MATYFLDTSAIVKRYILEPGQSLILDICADNNLLAIASAEGLQVENPNNYPAEDNSESKTGDC